MLIVLGGLLFIALIFGPQIWIRYTLNANAVERADFPGTGGELARHLLDQAGLQDIKVEETTTFGDHYSPDDKVVRLSPNFFNGKSVTAVAVAAHEVGHAIQDRDGYWALDMRQRLVKKILPVERIGSMVLMATPIVFLITKSPAVLLIELALALGILASSIVIHIFTLPTEFDASFKKALPILENYIPSEDMRGARKVLRAAAFTYVAGALMSLLNVARWLRILRF